MAGEPGRHEVIYYGSPALASLLRRHLEDEGCRVKVPPIKERRDLPGAAETYVIAMAVWGTQAAIRAAIRKFKARRPDAKIDVDRDDTTGYI